MKCEPPLKSIDEEFEELSDPSKMKIECICPKCGQRHIMNFHWIGRGTPRKFCPICRAST
jgi:hypothetical protein